MKRKHLNTILFASFGLLSASLGLFKASQQDYQAAKADEFKIEMHGSSISFGSYPNYIMYQEMMDTLDAEATMVENDKYEYQGNYYTPVVGKPSGGGEILPGGIYTSQIWNKKCWFRWDPIEWLFVKEENGASLFLSKSIIETYKWQSGSYTPSNDWENSMMREFLNGEFLNKAFTAEEQTAISDFTSSENTSKKSITDKVSLISKTELDKHEQFLNAKGTGYAMARSLRYDHNYNDNNEAIYYLNSIQNTSSPDEVDIAHAKKTNESFSTNDTRADSEIGVRPLVAINSSYLVKSSSGGGGSGARVGSGNVTLILAIIFSIFGMAGVTMFFLLWKKGKLFKVGNVKMPIIAISASLVVTIVGVSLLFASTGGKGFGYSAGSPVGYYAGTEFTLDVASPTFGYRYYMGLSKDHKAYRYYSDNFEDSVTNPVIHRLGGVGSWKLEGKKLVIIAGDDWDIFSWEDEITTYYATNEWGFAKNGRIMNYGEQAQESYQVQGYRWSHSTDTNPTGEEVKLSDIHFYDM